MQKECLARPKECVNPCVQSNYNCYKCKYWAYKEIEVEEPSNWYKVASSAMLLIMFILFIIALNIFS